MEHNRKLTDARISLGRTGTGIPHREALAFKLAHACARDAVYARLELDALEVSVRHLGLPVVHLNSRASDRNEYLQRPDLGRQPAPESMGQLSGFSLAGYDLGIILADGLSPEAVMRHAPALLDQLLPTLRSSGWSLAPLVIAEQARVAIGDAIGQVLGARLTLVLIGERPGLSSPHSMGAYLTWNPHPGCTDELRNCVSNIRPEGLPYDEAAQKLLYLLHEATRRRLSGVELKDHAGALPE